MVTLAALCLANGLDMHDAAEVELARIWTKVEAIRAKQAAKPKHSPLPVAAHGDEAVVAGEPAADLHRLFEDAWANALCSDEGVPGKRPLRSLSDREQYRGGGVNAAWRWFQRGAQLSAAMRAQAGEGGEV